MSVLCTLSPAHEGVKIQCFAKTLRLTETPAYWSQFSALSMSWVAKLRLAAKICLDTSRLALSST